jgi:hypothetical protein
MTFSFYEVFKLKMAVKHWGAELHYSSYWRCVFYVKYIITWIKSMTDKGKKPRNGSYEKMKTVKDWWWLWLCFWTSGLVKMKELLSFITSQVTKWHSILSQKNRFLRHTAVIISKLARYHVYYVFTKCEPTERMNLEMIFWNKIYIDCNHRCYRKE